MQSVIEGETLRQIQLVQLEILIEFDRICKENNLSYQLFSGTLLGAVRHKGFIPWDDDLDVCMHRDDYIKFMNTYKNKLNGKYFLQTYETDPNYIHSFARLRKNNTLAIQKTYENINMHHGIFIDIFPSDNIQSNTFLGKIQRKMIYPFRNIKRLKIKNRCLNSKNKFYTYIKLFIYYLLKPFSMRFLNKIETRIVTMFSGSKSSISTCLTDGGKETYENYIIINQRFYDTIDMEFEGHLFPVPRNYHEVLTRNFGDYMTPPPIEQQKPHHGIIEICFDTSSKAEG